MNHAAVRPEAVHFVIQLDYPNVQVANLVCGDPQPFQVCLEKSLTYCEHGLGDQGDTSRETGQHSMV